MMTRGQPEGSAKHWWQRISVWSVASIVVLAAVLLGAWFSGRVPDITTASGVTTLLNAGPSDRVAYVVTDEHGQPDALLLRGATFEVRDPSEIALPTQEATFPLEIGINGVAMDCEINIAFNLQPEIIAQCKPQR